MRRSGILLPIFSLDGDFGIGEIGKHARLFVDKLADLEQQSWQILPIGPTGYGDSPYQASSSFAGNELLISFDDLIEEGLLSSKAAARAAMVNNGSIDYRRTIPIRTALLDRVADEFSSGATALQTARFEEFCAQHASTWLDDYASYCVIKHAHGLKPWYRWPAALRHRESKTLSAIEERFAKARQRVKIKQFLFFTQWRRLRSYCREKGVQLIGDMPIFISHDSVESWCRPELFHFDSKGECTIVAGVPPDYFSETGQRWGNPIYRWDKHHQQNFRWWFQRLDSMLELVDLLRIDHFRGFEAYWAIPATEKTAIKGRWIKAPGRELFARYREHNPDGRFIAEDLGVITPEVEQLRDDFGLPGMRVLQFAFDDDIHNIHLPDQCPVNCVAYTSTHDNDTLRGWLDSERLHPLIGKRLGIPPKDIDTWSLITRVMQSAASWAIFPLQDVLDLDTTARINTPATTEGNWRWRYRAEQLSDFNAEGLRELTRETARDSGTGSTAIPQGVLEPNTAPGK